MRTVNRLTTRSDYQTRERARRTSTVFWFLVWTLVFMIGTAQFLYGLIAVDWYSAHTLSGAFLTLVGLVGLVVMSE